jgi:dolichyl-phosphate-mannose--protein O-mannosyl transferase
LSSSITNATSELPWRDAADISPFGEDWWLWLVFTGWSVGCVCSVKWVGMFATALVGVYTIEDLWNKFGDLSMPIVSLPKRRLLTLANVHQTLVCSYRLPDYPPFYGLRNLF